MIQISRWKIIFALAVCFLTLVYALPNVLSPQAREWMQRNLPSWYPTQTVNLGLDLQGGSHLLLGVDLDTVMRERNDDLGQSVRTVLREQRIGHTRLVTLPNGLRVTLRDPADNAKARKAIQNLDQGLSVLAASDGRIVEATFTDAYIKTTQDQAISQSIEIIRRRVDESGTREPIIQRQGADRVLVQLPGVEDPERMKDLIGQTAKLTFHTVPSDREGAVGLRGGTRILPLAEHPGQTITINRRAQLTGELLTNAQTSFDQNGAPAVSFRFNSTGARKFCDLSTKHVGQPFAIVLDDVVISAPTIREPICGGSGQISGNFTVQETNDLALLLRAGALPAPLKVLEERSVGPSLGTDSIQAGLTASYVASGLVIAYMIWHYGLLGVFASVALAINIVMIFAMMTTFGATLTLPGIAGIVLTIGMAVDANVIIYERIKDELRLGRSVISAVDTGFQRAMTSILDSNLTTLISALMLYSFGTGPIKGFSVTLTMGIIASLFSAVLVTRLLLALWINKTRPATLNI